MQVKALLHSQITNLLLDHTRLPQAHLEVKTYQTLPVHRQSRPQRLPRPRTSNVDGINAPSMSHLVDHQ